MKFVQYKMKETRKVPVCKLILQFPTMTPGDEGISSKEIKVV
jgi:hypothetical protein